MGRSRGHANPRPLESGPDAKKPYLLRVTQWGGNSPTATRRLPDLILRPEEWRLLGERMGWVDLPHRTIGAHPIDSGFPHGATTSAATDIRNLVRLAEDMQEGEDKRHRRDDPKRACYDCRTIDSARAVADGLDPVIPPHEMAA